LTGWQGNTGWKVDWVDRVDRVDRGIQVNELTG